MIEYSEGLRKKWDEILFFAGQNAKLNGVISGEIMAFVAEIDHLDGIEEAAIKQSEEVKKNWLSPVEAHGLKQLVSYLKEDGERLANVMVWKGELGHWYCDGCNKSSDSKDGIPHKDDCPITLHVALMEKIEKAGI
jgi:hypothetical protein